MPTPSRTPRASGRAWLPTAAALLALAPALPARAAAPLPGAADPDFLRADAVVHAVDRLAGDCAREQGLSRAEQARVETWEAANGAAAIRAHAASLAADPAQRSTLEQTRSALLDALAARRFAPCPATMALVKLPDAQLAERYPRLLAVLRAAGPASGASRPAAPPAATATAPSASAAELAARIERFGFDFGAGIGVGGFVTTRIFPVVLFRDGSALTQVEELARPGGLDASRRARPAAWTRWRRRGGELQLLADGAWKKLGFQKTYAHLPPDLRLEGSFRALGGAGTLGAGGTDAVTAWTTYRFSRDGTLARGGGAGGRAERGTTAVATAAAAGERRGRYRIDGLILEIAYEDGGSERRVLVTDPADPDGVIWLDGEGYVRR